MKDRAYAFGKLSKFTCVLKILLKGYILLSACRWWIIMPDTSVGYISMQLSKFFPRTQSDFHSVTLGTGFLKGPQSLLALLTLLPMVLGQTLPHHIQMIPRVQISS